MKTKRTVSLSEMILPDATRRRCCARAHTIRDTIKALLEAGAFEMLQTTERDQVAAALGVPALWIEAALDLDSVTLEALNEWQDWNARVMRRGKAGA